MNLYCTVIGQKNRDGIYRFRFEEKKGTLLEAGKEESFPAAALAIWERGRILYAVSQEQEGSRICSYSIQPDGSLTRRTEKEYGFSGVSYVKASEDGRFLWVAAYGCRAVAAVSLPGRPSRGKWQPGRLFRAEASIRRDRNFPIPILSWRGKKAYLCRILERIRSIG